MTVAPPPAQENNASQNDIWAVELPYGMPKDSHLLPQHSQDLLRAARSGKIYKRPAPAEEEEADPEVIPGDKPEKKEEDTKDRGFAAKAWKQIPRHLEGADIEYLAKRRKGLVTASSKPAAPVPTVIKTTVKRTDAAGNEYTQDVVVPHGQQVDGEVIAQVVIPDPSAAPADPNAGQPTPQRKKPINRKKTKGPGRGRKKKHSAPTSIPQPTLVDGVASGGPTADGATGAEVKTEDGIAGNEDTEMGDGSQANSDDEEGDSDEDGEEGAENDETAENSPAKSQPRASQEPSSSFTTIPDLSQPDTAMSGTEIPLPPKLQTSHSGSPLKNVALTTSALASPLGSPTVASPLTKYSPVESPPHQASQSPVAAPPTLADLNEEMQQEVAETAPIELPPPPPEPTEVEIQAAVEMRREEEEEEEMLLDIVDNANNAHIGGLPAVAVPEVLPPVLAEVISEVEIPDEKSELVELEQPVQPIQPLELTEPTEPTEPLDPVEPVELVEPVESTEPTEPAKPAPVSQEEDDDDFPDLLGGLEKSLENKPTTVTEVPEPAPIEVESTSIENEKETAEPEVAATNDILAASEEASVQ